ncbi:sulfite exporter TauE/SafE family protein [Tropicimonas sp. IMCC34011]|uniref:sulfite exporter TauE/SafE family protein n=1 Tax=Tropicimonas sp. IMCC34011 TaxID=2248759 RepID=UPI000E21DCCB|nr:sulfite exporter TauE/SafE family protein [Tropicimonas sp. IMCC34011]
MDHLYILLIAALIVGASKGGLASAGAIAVPLCSLVMNPVVAAAVLLPVFLVTDWVGVFLYRRDFSARNLAILIPAMFAGVLLATVITPYTPEPLLLIVTGLIGLWYVGRKWLARGPEGPAAAARVAPGLFWGVLTGVTSFITHSGAPPAQAFLLPQRLPKLQFAGTIAIAFAAGNLAKLPGYWALGALDGLDWTLTAILAATGIAGTILGRRLVGVLPDALYLRVIEVLLFGLSIVLITKGALGVL